MDGALGLRHQRHSSELEDHNLLREIVTGSAPRLAASAFVTGWPESLIALRLLNATARFRALGVSASLHFNPKGIISYVHSP